MNVGFVGIGKLGRDVAETMANKHNVVGYDIREVETTIPTTNNLSEAVKNKDFVFIAVPTPHDPDYDGKFPTSHLIPKDFEYSILLDITKKVSELTDEKTLIVLISTVLPGTIRRLVKPILNNKRFIYNPYLIAQGTVKWDFLNPEMIIIGNENAQEDGNVKKLFEFYKTMISNPRIEFGTWEEAESIKIFYNTFITTKLCLVNMIQDVSEKVRNINVDIVTNALKNSTMRIMGPSYMKAGFGDGGGCHPRDNIALRWLAKEYDIGYDLFSSIMLSREVQAKNMAVRCLEYNKNVVILGKSFKPGLKDQDEGSPSILVGWYIENLSKNKIKVFYDIEPNKNESFVYLIHDNITFKDHQFNQESIIIDPYRELRSSRKDLTIVHYGNTRTL